MRSACPPRQNWTYLQGQSSDYSAALLMQALLWRQWLLKTRSWGSTLAEILSPIVLMSALLLAYGLVHPDHSQSRVSRPRLSAQQVVKACSLNSFDAAEMLFPGPATSRIHLTAIEMIVDCICDLADLRRRHRGAAAQYDARRAADGVSLRPAAVRGLSAERRRRQQQWQRCDQTWPQRLARPDRCIAMASS